MKQSILDAAKKGNVEALQILLKDDVDGGESILCKEKNESGNNALLIAVYYGRENVVRYLCSASRYSAKTIRDIKNKAGNNALIEGAYRNQYGIVKLLLTEFSSIFGTIKHEGNGHESNALLQVALGGDEHIINDGNDYIPLFELLVYHGLSVNSTNQYGQNVLLRAASRCRTRMVQHILTTYPNINKNQKDSEGRNALLSVVTSNHESKRELMHYLIREHQFNVEETDNKGNNVLLKAAHLGDIVTCKDLLNHYPKLKTTSDPDRNNALLIATIRRHKALVQCFIDDYGFDINARNRFGNNGLLLAAKFGHQELVEYFLKVKHCDINVYNKDKENILMRASAQGHFSLVQFIIEQNQIDLEQKSNKGQTAREIAAQNNKSEIVRLLKEAAEQQVNNSSAYSNRNRMRP